MKLLQNLKDSKLRFEYLKEDWKKQDAKFYPKVDKA